MQQDLRSELSEWDGIGNGSLMTRKLSFTGAECCMSSRRSRVAVYAAPSQ